jgi:hypothetical protein
MMEVANIMSKAYDIVRNNPKIVWPYIFFLLFLGGIGLGASYAALSPFYTVGLNAQVANPTPTFFYHMVGQVYHTVAPILIGVLLLALFIGPILYGIYVSIADQGLQKTRVNLGRAFSVAKKNYVKILLASILVLIIWGIVGAIFVAVFVSPAAYLGLQLGSVLWVLIGSVLLVLAIILLGIFFFTLYPAVVLERLKPMMAIQRSYEIGRKHMWLIFRLLFVTLIVEIGAGVVISLITTAVQIPVALLSPIWGVAVAQIVNIVLNAALVSWTILIPVVFYKEHVGKRMRMKK